MRARMRPASPVRLSKGAARGFHGLSLFPLVAGRAIPFTPLRIVVAPRTDLPMIHHAKLWEFFYVLKGEGFGRVGRRDVRFSAGQHVVIPPGVRHDFHTGRRALEALVVFSPRFDFKRPDVVRAAR